MKKTTCKKVISILFKIQDFLLKNIELKSNNSVVIDAENTNAPICPHCKKECATYDSKIKTIKIGFLLGRQIYMRFKIRRVKCKTCNKISTEYLTFYEPKKSYSKALGDAILKYTKIVDNKSVSKLTGLSESTIYRIDKKMLKEKFKNYKEKICEIKKLSIDEVAYRKGHNYFSVFTDIDNSKVVWIEEGRKYSSCLRGLKHLKDKLNNLEVVSMDLWKSYEHAVDNFFKGNVKIVFDKFHLSKLLNKAVEEERRVYQREVSLKELAFIKRKVRWIILKRYSNQDIKGKSYINYLKELNSPLYELYLVKESFLSIFERGLSYSEGMKLLFRWIIEVLNSKFVYLKRFAKKVLKRIHKLLNWFIYPVSTSKSEGLNNVIKTLIKRAYGYKDRVYLKLKILQVVGYLS